MDYIKVIRDVITPLVSKPEALLIREVPSDKGENHLQFLVVADSNDTARLIGKGGSVAEAIREVVGVAGKLSDKHVYVKFESYEDKKD